MVNFSAKDVWIRSLFIFHYLWKWEGDWAVEAGGLFEPYQNEPRGPDSSDSDDEDEDEDGLTPGILESRFEREITVHTW